MLGMHFTRTACRGGSLRGRAATLNRFFDRGLVETEKDNVTLTHGVRPIAADQPRKTNQSLSGHQALRHNGTVSPEETLWRLSFGFLKVWLTQSGGTAQVRTILASAAFALKPLAGDVLIQSALLRDGPAILEQIELRPEVPARLCCVSIWLVLL